jgi:DamX protein
MTSLHADEAFLGHYQFSHDPFAARVPGFKFFPAQRKPVLGQLHHLARYSQLLLVVSGPVGSGKTLLRQALVASTNKQTVQSIVVSAKTGGDVAGVLRQVAQGLGLQQADMRAILAHVVQLALTGQEVYVLVDDAEHLADAALDTLFALAVGSPDGRPHVFLFGESSLIPRLELLADGEERFHAIELQPYSEDETREYLAQRLDGAGQGIDVLSDEQIADIHEQSGGWPGSINQVARETLIDAMLANRGAAAKKGLGLPKKHLLALLVVALGVGAAWFMQGRKHDDSPIPAMSVPVDEQEKAASAENPAPASDGSKPLALPLPGEAQPVIRAPLAQAAGLEEGEEDGAVAEVPVAVPNPAPTPSAPAAVPVAPVQVAPVPAPAAAPAPVVAAPTPKPAAVPAAAPVKPVAAAPKPIAKPTLASATKATADTGWHGSQPGGHFALQVFGTRSESGAQAFIGKQGGDYHYFKKMHQGQPLYVVTYGNFSSRAAAQAAIKSLPASVQAGKPWPRTFASIQQEAVRTR